MRGRPRLAVPKVEWAVCISTPLASQVELLLYDPVLERTAVGARSKLIETLLRDWVEKQRKEEIQ